MNLYVYETARNAVVVDCGVMFPNASMPGVDCLYPRMDYLKQIKKKIDGIVFTHGHEDHIGGVDMLVDILRVPIYTGAFTARLVEHKLSYGQTKAEIKVVDGQRSHEIGGFKIDFVRLPHSIPDTYGLRLTSGDFSALHMSDLRADNFNKLAASLKTDNLTCLLLDSTNANSSNKINISEEEVYENLVKLFKQAKGRIFFTTFASNVTRVSSVARAAKRVGRKIVIVGAAMERTTLIAKEMGLIDLPDDMLLTANTAFHEPADDLVYMAGGCQGEFASALHSIAFDERRVIKMSDDDTLIFSSRAIPGNEMNISAVINAAMRLGADVVQASDEFVHTSGHITPKDAEMLIKALKPKYFIPIHGEYMHIKKNIDVAVKSGVRADNCLLMESGEKLIFRDSSFMNKREVPSGRLYADHRGNYLFDDDGLNVRRQLARDGLVLLGLDGKGVRVRTYGFTMSNAQSTQLKGMLKDIHTGVKGGRDLIIRTVRRYFRKYQDRRPVVEIL
ncbi:ribonuclease J [Deferribacterales bacterium]|nr:ribonuclease J [Deferribacterales bacterium]